MAFLAEPLEHVIKWFVEIVCDPYVAFHSTRRSELALLGYIRHQACDGNALLGDNNVLPERTCSSSLETRVFASWTLTTSMLDLYILT